MKYALCEKLCLVYVLFGALGMVGCRGPIAPHPDTNKQFTRELGTFREMPRARLGSLPFPGPFTLYTDAQADKLGHHSYSGQTPKGAEKECDRGILYTRRAGFLDVCHVRNAADMTAYVHARISLALTRGWDEVRFRGHEPSVYTLRFSYPDGWDEMDRADREEIIEELSIRTAERVAFDVMTWHEIITWYGFKSTVVVSEKGSAFTHDDVPSHALGVELAGESIRSGGDFDAEMTARLDEALRRLGAVESEELKTAQELVKDEWWTTLGGAKRRMLDIGLGDGKIEPWVIDELAAGPPAVFTLASLDNIVGHRFDGFYELEIDPKILEGFPIRSRLNGDPSRIVPEEHFEALIADIAETLEQDLPVADNRYHMAADER